MNDKLKIFGNIVIGVSITVLSAAIIFMASQVVKVDDIEQSIQQLPTAVESKKLDDTIKNIQSQSGKNNMRLQLLIMNLRAKGVISEKEADAILNSNFTK